MACEAAVRFEWQGTFIHGRIAEGPSPRSCSVPAKRLSMAALGFFEREENYVSGLWEKAEALRVISGSTCKFIEENGVDCQKEVTVEATDSPPVLPTRSLGGQTDRWADVFADEELVFCATSSETSTHCDDLSGNVSSQSDMSPQRSIASPTNFGVPPPGYSPVQSPKRGGQEPGLRGRNRADRGAGGGGNGTGAGAYAGQKAQVVATQPVQVDLPTSQRSRRKGERNSRARRAQKADGNASKIAPQKDLPITTLMIRHIPCCIRQCQLKEAVDRTGYRGKYDFLYLPVLEDGSSNLGYGFINFRTADDASAFSISFSGHKFENTKSTKVCEVKPARLQGFKANSSQFGSSFSKGRDAPLCFQ